MGKVLRRLIVSVVVAVSVVACNTTGCMENQSSIPLAGLYSATDSSAIALRDISVGGVGAPSDSLIYSSGTTLTSVYLPLRANKNSTSFFFHYAQEGIDSDAYNDTITIDYESVPKFVSEECGAMYFYRVRGVAHTTHLIQGVEVTDSLISNFDTERLRIYFRVQESDSDDGGDSEQASINGTAL